MTFYAYIHARPDATDSSGVVYVGKGKGDRYRVLPKRNRYHGFVVDKHGAENILTSKIECSDEATAFALEQGLIKCLKRAGVALTNMTDGGEGVAGWVASEETRARMSVASREVAKRPGVRERRASATAKHAKERWADPEQRERQIEGMRGNRKTRSEASDAARRANGLKGTTLEARAKRAAASKAMWADPEFKARMAEKKRTAWQDAEKRAAMLEGRSEGIKKSWADPEVRSKRITGIKKASTRDKEGN